MTINHIKIARWTTSPCKQEELKHINKAYVALFLFQKVGFTASN